MSKLFDDASLAMIPSAYKDGKLYSIRPIPEYGSEEVTNGDFATDTAWTKEAGWTISGGKASYNGSATTNALFQNISATSGTTYRVSFSVVNYVSGSFKAHLSNGSATGASPLITANGDYVFDITATGGLLLFRNVTSFNGSIDNVSVQEIVSSGDFTFSRGSNLAATRVNADGLIEKGRENFLTYSNDFEGTDWTIQNITTTSGQVGYDGSNNAWKFIPNTSNTYHRVIQAITIGTNLVVTLSVYAKADGYNFIRISENASTGHYATFNLSTGVVENKTSLDAKIESVGNGWYRCSSTIIPSTTRRFDIYVMESANVQQPWAGDGTSGVLIQDGQFEQGLVATDYIETGTSAAQSGILEDMPRLDYSGSCPSLLLEPQRTNICPNSEDVSNWYLTFATATANDTISPEGVQNAAKIVTSSAGCDVKLTSIPVSPSTTYTATFYCKLTSGSGLQTRFYDNTNGANIEYYDYSSQLVVGEWKRVTRTFTTPAGCNNIQIWFLAASSSASVTAHYWGYQLEAGSYPTSYIPTYGTSQTRSNESASVLNLDTNNIVGDTQWSVLAEFDVDGNAPSTDKIRLTNATNNPRVYVYNDAAGFAGGWGGAMTAGQNRVKILWRLNTLRSADIFAVGAKQVSVTAQPSDLIVDRLLLNGGQGTFKLYNITIFPTALTDSECIALTTI